MRYRPGSSRSSVATPLSDEVTGGNVAARAPSSSPVTVTVAPGTTAPDVSTTVTIKRPSCPLCARTRDGVTRIEHSTSAGRNRRSMSRAWHRPDDGAMNSVRLRNTCLAEAFSGADAVGLFCDGGGEHQHAEILSNPVTGFVTLLALLLAAVILAALARRMGAPYPAFLAIGGALLAFVPGEPALAIEPHLALALFVAPVLLDAAFDSSPRDMKANWVPLVNLVVLGVAVTTVAVAVVMRILVPTMPWASGDRSGSDRRAPRCDGGDGGPASRQTATPYPDDPRRREPVERRQRSDDLPSGSRGVCGEHILDTIGCPDVSARRLGSIVAGRGLAWLVMRLTKDIRDVPTSIVLQFINTFGVWILAEEIGLSGVLTMVCFAVSVARPAAEMIRHACAFRRSRCGKPRSLCSTCWRSCSSDSRFARF